MEKLCGRCGKNPRDTANSWCRPCRLEYQKQYRQTHKAELRESAKVWRKEHPDKVKAWQKRHYAKLTDEDKRRRADYHKQWCQDNQEYCRNYRQAWRYKNRERYNEYMREYMRKRRAEKAVMKCTA